VHDLANLQADTSTAGTQWGTGGMATKLTAGRIATAAGCKMVICNSNVPENMPLILTGAPIGTLFHPVPQHLRGRKRWILSVPVRWVLAGGVAARRPVTRVVCCGWLWAVGSTGTWCCPSGGHGRRAAGC
jgi:glutamate 5-kinase